MKRTVCCILIMLMMLSLFGCGSEGGSKAGVSSLSPTVNDVLEQQTSGDDAQPQEQAGTKEIKKGSVDKVDIDLTTGDSTMVYSQVYNMIIDPDSYIGKSVKMDGTFQLYYSEEYDQYYYACVIADATACCSQGLEFVLAGDYTYPDDYPELGTEITVAGTFSTYMEGEYQYCNLVDAQFL